MKLNQQLQELIAIGASIAANCQPCLQYHVHQARQAGLQGEEIADAIEIGRMVRKGAAAKMDRYFPQLALESATDRQASPLSTADCGCSG